LSNLHKIGKNNIENWGRIGKIINKIGNYRNFRIVSFDTVSAHEKRIEQWNRSSKRQYQSAISGRRLSSQQQWPQITVRTLICSFDCTNVLAWLLRKLLTT